jgi:hypothetical protein
MQLDPSPENDAGEGSRPEGYVPAREDRLRSPSFDRHVARREHRAAPSLRDRHVARSEKRSASRVLHRDAAPRQHRSGGGSFQMNLAGSHRSDERAIEPDVHPLHGTRGLHARTPFGRIAIVGPRGRSRPGREAHAARGRGILANRGAAGRTGCAEPRTDLRPVRPPDLRSREARDTLGASGCVGLAGVDLSRVSARPAGLGGGLGPLRGVRRNEANGNARQGDLPGMRPRAGRVAQRESDTLRTRG